MTEDELKNELANLSSESEVVEFKEWKNNISIFGNSDNRKCIYAYLVALGNEGAGTLYIGVADDGRITGTNFELPKDFKEKMFESLKARVEVENIEAEEGKIIIIKIPQHPVREVYRFYGVPLMRIDDGLREMDTETLRSILNEVDSDFTATLISGLNIEDLDVTALTMLKKRYARKSGNDRIYSLSNIQLLQDLELMKGSELNVAALLLLGRREKIGTYLAEAEIIFEYRNDPNQIAYSERENYREPILLETERLWDKINNHNQIYQYQEGLIRRDIHSFNERATREALLNAIIHRDYQQNGSIFIKQDPTQITFESPGGFLRGVTPSNVIDKRSWRNRRLAEVLSKLGYVERSGQGADLIYHEIIKEGKGLPTWQRSDPHAVILDIPASVDDPEFIQYLEKVMDEKQRLLSVRDLIVLQRVKDMDVGITRSDVIRFLDMGIVEKVGRTNATRYILAHNYYKLSKQTGRYIRIKGLDRDVKKQIILEHLKKHGAGVKVSDLVDAFPGTETKDISNILQELRKDGLIKYSGITKHGVWKLV